VQSEVAIYVIELYGTAREYFENLGMVKTVLESKQP